MDHLIESVRMTLQAIAEKKAAILVRALQANPTNEDLLIAYLQAIQDQIDPEKLQGLWEAVVSKHSGSPRLWRSYLL